MPESEFTESKGQERLQSPKRFNFVFPDNFDLNSGTVEAKPMGGFSVLLINPETGELLEPEEARVIFSKNRKSSFYTPMAQEGDQIFLTYRWMIQGNEVGMLGQSEVPLLMKFEKGRWIKEDTSLATIVTFNPKGSSQQFKTIS